jgi:hypothetical protein
MNQQNLTGKKRTQKEKKMTTAMNQKQLEEFAFYESGLSADGCLQKLDSYALDSIERYGRILVQKQKENFIEGFQGCCYTCEPVGILNQQLEEQLKCIGEDGTEEHNAAVKLRSKLSEALVKNDQLEEIARRLYGVVLHLNVVTENKPIMVVGESLYNETTDAIKMYEDYNANT